MRARSPERVVVVLAQDTAPHDQRCDERIKSGRSPLQLLDCHNKTSVVWTINYMKVSECAICLNICYKYTKYSPFFQNIRFCGCPFCGKSYGVRTPAGTAGGSREDGRRPCGKWRVRCRPPACVSVVSGIKPESPRVARPGGFAGRRPPAPHGSGGGAREETACKRPGTG